MRRYLAMAGLWALLGCVYAISFVFAGFALLGRWAGGHTMDWLDALDAKRAKIARRSMT